MSGIVSNVRSCVCMRALPQLSHFHGDVAFCVRYVRYDMSQLEAMINWIRCLCDTCVCACDGVMA